MKSLCTYDVGKSLLLEVDPTAKGSLNNLCFKLLRVQL